MNKSWIRRCVGATVIGLSAVSMAGCVIELNRDDDDSGGDIGSGYGEDHEFVVDGSIGTARGRARLDNGRMRGSANGSSFAVSMPDLPEYESNGDDYPRFRFLQSGTSVRIVDSYSAEVEDSGVSSTVYFDDGLSWMYDDSGRSRPQAIGAGDAAVVIVGGVAILSCIARMDEICNAPLFGGHGGIDWDRWATFDPGLYGGGYCRFYCKDGLNDEQILRGASSNGSSSWSDSSDDGDSGGSDDDWFGDTTSTVDPYVDVSPRYGTRGTVFSQSGQGFSPYGQVQLVFVKPDYTTYDPIYETADGNGSYLHVYDSSAASLFGRYEYYAIDVETGAASPSVEFYIDP